MISQRGLLLKDGAAMSIARVRLNRWKRVGGKPMEQT
jgi:hypothetical protein